MLVGTVVVAVLILLLGPNVVGFFLWIAGMLVDVSMKYPIGVIVFLFLCKLLSSKLLQKLLVCLNLDADEDGDVDFLDVVHALGATPCGRCLRLDRLHTYLHDDLKLFRKPDPKKIWNVVRQVHVIVSETNREVKASPILKEESSQRSRSQSSGQAEGGSKSKGLFLKASPGDML